MMRQWFWLMTLAGLTACAGTGPDFANSAQSQLVERNYQAIDKLLAQPNLSLSAQQPMMVASLVSIDAMQESSTLGRLLGEQLAARLTQRGYRVLELKLRQSVFVRESQGELLLSREVKDITQSHQVETVLVGTYAVGGGYVYINVKLVRPQDNVVLAATDYVLPMNQAVAPLLRR